jgi:type 2 lantibiotic biosynthesis protein LanM
VERKTMYQFNCFLDYCLGYFNVNPEIKLVDIAYLKSLMLDICGKYLVLMINQKSANKELEGDTAEDRYQFFETHFSETGKAFSELIENYPLIYADMKNTIDSYLVLLADVQENFLKDFDDLYINEVIDSDQKQICSIKVKGDFHNGKAVVEVATKKNKLIYKPKSVVNELFFTNFLSFLSQLPTCTIPDFYIFKVLNKGTHGWIEFLENTPIISQEQANSYYERMGCQLAFAYLLNFTDLHFENIVCKSEYPVIVDLETIFNISLFQTEPQNLATTEILSKISNSVYATGMLPIVGNDNFFGGDTSGILGGKFTREERIIVNEFRDDIHFEKKVIRQDYTGHIPYVEKSGQRIYSDPYKYLPDILEGFSSGYQLFLKNKDQIIDYLRRNTLEVSVRVLARNTLEYSLLIQAAKSPIYSKNRAKIFNKLKQFDNGLGTDLVKSEIEQIETLSIPYFKCGCHSKKVTNLRGEVVYTVKNTPFDEFLSQLKRYTIKDLNEQKQFIEFSILSQEQLYTDGQDFIIYNYKTASKKYLEAAIQELNHILEKNAIIKTEDQSINWMSIGVSANDQIVFEALDNDVYKGLSGIGMALIEYYQVYHSKDTKRLIEIISFNVLSDIKKKMENELEIDFSFYNGILGELAFLLQAKANLNINLPGDIAIYFKKFVSLLKKEKVISGDIIGGIAGIIVFLFQLNSSFIAKKDILELGKKWKKEINMELSVASYAHGNSGIMTALLLLYQLSDDTEFLQLFKHFWEKEKLLKIENGWADVRKNSKETSVFWCHGASGQALARLKWLEVDAERKILSSKMNDQILVELNELIGLIIDNGLIGNNFCLCHGITGNLMLLDYYQKNFAKNDKKLEKKISDNFYSIARFGLSEGWICGLGNHFYSYGMMTGIAGILYAFVKYKNKKSGLGVLLPNI